MPGERNQTRFPPYVSYRTFRNFVEQLGPRVPARIDRSYWGDMFSGSSGGHLMSALRFLELIDDKGQPTDRLRPLAGARGDDRTSVLHDIAMDSFSFVFRGFPDPQNATYGQLEDIFRTRFPLSGDLSRKCLKFFIELSNDAGITLSPFITKRVRSVRGSTGTKSVTRKISTKTVARTGPARMNREPVVPENQVGSPVSVSWDEQLLTKFPTFDPSWSDEVKLKWFSGFDELLKRVVARMSQ